MRKEYYTKSQPDAPSLVGKRFKLSQRTLAIELDSSRTAVTIPAGAIINVVHDSVGTNQEQTVDVLWGNRKLEIFTCDVNLRGTEIKENSASA